MNRELTFLIKTFDRPEAVTRLLDSILHSAYGRCSIVLVDDGREPYEIPSRVADYLSINLVRLPFNSGLSAGRNAGLAKVETPFFCLLDDDMMIDKRFKPEMIIAKMRATGADIVSSKLDALKPRNYIASMRKQFDRNLRSVLIVDHDTPVKECPKGSGLVFGDWVLNCFIARTDAVRRVEWNHKIKIGHEHADFFWRAKSKGLKVAHENGSAIAHPKAPRSKHYTNYRRKHALYVADFFESVDAQGFIVKRGGEYVDRLRVDGGYNFNELYGRLPFEVEGKRVAVIGNGPSIKGGGMGAQIDSADIVVRFNNYKLQGHEHDTGTKTTVWATTFYHDVRDRLQFPAHVLCPLPKEYGTKKDTANRIKRARRINAAQQPVEFMPPAYMDSLKALCRRPSSGIAFLWWYVAEFDKMPDIVLGFDNFGSWPMHYFDKGTKPSHKPSQEREVMEYLKSWCGR